MSLRYILGGAGTGKTQLCFTEILTRYKSGRHLIYLIPEQYSLQSEHDLVNRSKGQSLTKVLVLSFQRLAYFMFSEIGKSKGSFLDDTGKHMLLKKVVNDNLASLNYYGRVAKKEGFIEKLNGNLTEFRRYALSPEALLNIALNTKNESLRLKLKDIALIYKEYELYVKDKYLFDFDSLDILFSRMDEGSYLKNAEIWIDSFTGFTPQEERILFKLIKTAKVNLTLPLLKKDLFYPELRETDPFFELKKTINHLTSLCRSHGLNIEDPVFLSKPQGYLSQETEFLAAAYFSGLSYPKPVHKIKICQAANKYDEIKQTADSIHQLLRQGYRYRDIGVLSSSAYNKSLHSLFAMAGIPVFIDETKPVYHPLTELVSALIDMVAYHFSYESVFRFLKTGLTGLSRDEIDILENYVLAYGIKGSKWKLRFRYGEKLYDLNALNETKERFLALVQPFCAKLDNTREFELRLLSTKLFQCLEGMDMIEALDQQALQQKDYQQKASSMNNLIWNKLVELFDKLVEILGSTKMQISEFSSVVQVGLQSIDLGILPPTQDQVLVGDFNRSRFPKIKALFVLGANEGILPEKKEATDLFTDDERSHLRATGASLAADIKTKLSLEQFQVYSALSKPSELLSLSYSLGSFDGKQLRPSWIINRIKKLFPQIQEEELSNNQEVSKVQAARKGQVAWKYDFGSGASSTSASSTQPLAWRSEALDSGKYSLPPRLLNNLYGKELVTGASMLENYARCPFAYFIQYNLKAKKRKIYEVEAVDLGNIFHYILEGFSKELNEAQKSWRGVTALEIDEYVDRSVSSTADIDVFSGNPANQYLLERVKRIAKASLETLVTHVKAGTFEPISSEYQFNLAEPLTGLSIALEGEQKLILTGRIDRVDIWDDGQDKYVKIIDYKSGNTKFDLEDIYLGMQLQLILYLDAFIKSLQAYYDKNSIQVRVLPGGVFYFNIKDPYIHYKEDLDIEQKRLEAYKMSGLTLSDKDVFLALDSSIDKGGKSAIIPVSLKKDGDMGAVSKAMDLDSFNQLRETVLEKIKALGSDIKSGKIPVKPFRKGNKSACDYCDYSGICKINWKKK